MSNTAHRAEIEKQAQVTIYIGTKSAQTVLSWKGNPQRAIESLAIQLGEEINHWHFN
jgi:hypothetical protein